MRQLILIEVPGPLSQAGCEGLETRLPKGYPATVKEMTLFLGDDARSQRRSAWRGSDLTVERAPKDGLALELTVLRPCGAAHMRVA